MKPYQIGSIVLIYFSILLNGCNSLNFLSFQSDDNLISLYRSHMNDFNRLIKKCTSESHSQPFKKDIYIKFSVCNLDEIYLSKINLKEISVQYEGDKSIFMTNQYTTFSIDVFLEEKGILHTKHLIQDNIANDLDQYNGKNLVTKQGISEVWKYRKIAPEWYLYYRQYFRAFN